MLILNPMPLDEEQSNKTEVNEDSGIEKDQSDDESFYSYEFPSSDEDEYFDHIDNQQIFLDDHLTRHQKKMTDSFEFENYRRSKRSNKKLKFKRHRSKNEIQKIKFLVHQQSTHVHHDLVEVFDQKLPRQNRDPSSIYSSGVFRPNSFHYEDSAARTVENSFQPTPVFLPVVPPAIRQHMIDPQTLAAHSEFDDQMIGFLIDMQNRDLSPDDYEMLLRLDERIERKTIRTSVLDKFDTIQAGETHLSDQCTICMENYALGQAIKALPCQHVFHCDCIENYLKNFSNKCPLDNLPIE